MAQTVQEILAAAKKAGASDVHITVGIPPKMRVNGKLITMEGERLLPPDTMEIANSVMNDTQKQRLFVPEKERPDTRHRPDRKRQIHDSCRHYRQDQQ